MANQIRICPFVAALLVSLFLAGTFARDACAGMYRWVDQNGTVHITDAPPQAGSAKIETVPTRRSDTGSEPEAKEPRTDRAQPVRQTPPAKDRKVELYTTSWCPWCKKAREFFHARGIQFTEYDVEKDAEAARRKAKLDRNRGVPFAVIDGTGISGYNEAAYLRALTR